MNPFTTFSDLLRNFHHSTRWGFYVLICSNFDFGLRSVLVRSLSVLSFCRSNFVEGNCAISSRPPTSNRPWPLQFSCLRSPHLSIYPARQRNNSMYLMLLTSHHVLAQISLLCNALPLGQWPNLSLEAYSKVLWLRGYLFVWWLKEPRSSSPPSALLPDDSS